MNNKNNDTELITAERIQNNYPQITLVSETSTKLTENSSNHCAPKTPAVQTTMIPVTTSSVTKINIPTIKNTPSPATDRKLPPYVNAVTQDPLRASKIPAQKPTFVKTPPKLISEKGIGTVESAITSLQTSPSIVRTPVAGDVKKSQNTQPVRTNIFQTVPKLADEVVVSRTTTSADENKSTSVSEGEHKYASPVQSTRSPQIQRTSDALKKSIDSNAITVTSRTVGRNSPSAVKVIPSKDTKTAETNTIQSKDSAKVVNVSRIVAATNSPKSDTADLKPHTVEPILKTVPKVVVVTSVDTSVRTKSPSVKSANSKLDSKIRNVSNETTIETIAKQLNNPGSPVQENENGNPTEDVVFIPESTEAEKMIDIVSPLEKEIDEPDESIAHKKKGMKRKTNEKKQKTRERVNSDQESDDDKSSESDDESKKSKKSKYSSEVTGIFVPFSVAAPATATPTPASTPPAPESTRDKNVSTPFRMKSSYLKMVEERSINFRKVFLSREKVKEMETEILENFEKIKKETEIRSASAID